MIVFQIAGLLLAALLALCVALDYRDYRKMNKK